MPEFDGLDRKLRGRAHCSRDDLRALGVACREFGISRETCSVLAHMASYPPPLRLAINLKTVVGLMLKRPVQDVLREGLLPEEYQSLAELDLSGMPGRMREVAHGLFNVHERWCLLKELRRLFRQAELAKDEFLEPRQPEEDEPSGPSAGIPGGLLPGPTQDP